MYDINQPGAPVLRDEDQRRGKDRHPVIRYGARDWSGKSKFTNGEQLLLNTDGRLDRDRYLLATIDDADSSTEPLATRSSLVRLLAVALWNDADIMLESSRVNHQVRAILGQLALRRFRGGAPLPPLHIIDTRDVAVHPRRSDQKRYSNWTEATDPHELNRLVESLMTGTVELFLKLHRAGIEDKAIHLLALEGQPLRDSLRARSAAEHLREQRWNDREIRDYLALNGFLNHSGNIGVWTHAQYKQLGV